MGMYELFQILFVLHRLVSFHPYNADGSRNMSQIKHFLGPLWRKRHLPRIGGVCLAEGGKSGGLFN